tara:strand:- start:3268 stop:4008 length:741 start_codon:yes stop_codon:yes gene_type:complete
MANTLAGMLTGVERGGIDPNASSQAQQMQLGAQASQMMQQGMRGLTGQSQMSKGQQLQQAMGKLNPNDPEDARTLTMLLQSTGDYAGAAKLAANLQKLQKEKDTREMLITRAETMGNPDMAAFLKAGGDLGPAITVLFREQPRPDIAGVTDNEYDTYAVLLQQLDPDNETGFDLRLGSIGRDSRTSEEKTILFQQAEELRAKTRGLSMQDALRRAMGMAVVSPQGTSATSAATAGDSFAGKNIISK